jgi:hypothetical protein
MKVTILLEGESLNNKSEMKRNRKKLFAAIVIIAFASGCGGGVTTPMYQLNVGAMIADFPNGAGFNSSMAQAETQGTNYVIYATQNVGGQPADEITLSVPISADLPYTVTGSGGSDIIYRDALTGKDYEANGAQGNCQITITQTSPSIEGTFSATAICADSSVVLNNGQFNASF